MQTACLDERPSSDVEGRRFFVKLDAPYPVDDQDGELYLGPIEAREDAITFLSDLLKDRMREIKSGERWQVLVHDENAALVCRLQFTAEFGA